MFELPDLTTKEYVEQILNAKFLKFCGVHRQLVFFGSKPGGNGIFGIPPQTLETILVDDEYTSVRKVFTDRITNPGEFITADRIRAWNLSKDLKLKARMSAFIDEPI